MPHDPYLNLDALPVASIDAIATRMEERANHSIFSSFIDEYASMAALNRSSLNLPTGTAQDHPSGPIRLLEVGTGTGVVLRKLKEHVHPDSKLTGIDISAKLLAIAKEREHSEGSIEYIQNEGIHIPFPDASFDVIVLHTLLSHVPDTAGLLAEVSRVLDPAGKVIIFEPDHCSTTFGLSDLAKMRAMDYLLVSTIATHPDAARQVPRNLKSAGLKICQHKSYVISETGKGDFFLSSVRGYARLLPTLGVVDPAVVEEWATEMLTAHEEGTFFAAGNFYTFICSK